MAELDDLNAALAALTTAVADVSQEISDETAEILSLLAAPKGIDPAAVEASAQNIQTLSASLEKSVADAKAALNPPTPTPAA
jgi:uracil phosphoribosyltransferase